MLDNVTVRLNNVSIFRCCYFVSTIDGLQTSSDVCYRERVPSVVLIVPGLIVHENVLVANYGPLLNMAFSVLSLVHYFLSW